MAIQRTVTTPQQVAAGLGWFSIGLGAAEILFPSQVARLIGAPATDRTCTILRGFGAGEVAAGVAILARSHASRGWELEAARGFEVGYSVTIRRPVEDVYRFWRNFANFPRFMRDLESVTVSGDRRSRWRVSGPAGIPVEWDAEIVSEQENHMISWRSLPGSSIENRGAVRFEEAPAGRGTEVHVKLAYRPPAGKVGRTIAWLFGKEPRQQLREDLRRVKQILEVGEVPLSDGPGLSTPARPPISAEAAKVLLGVET